MKECRYCHTKYNDQLHNCPSCGSNVVVTPDEAAEKEALRKYEVANQEKAVSNTGINKGKLIGILAAVVALIVVVIVVASSIGKGSKPAVVNPGNNGEASSYTSNPGSIQSGQSENDVSALIERANSLYSRTDKKDFIEFVNSNQNTLGSNADIMEKYNSAVQILRDAIIQDAEASFNKGDYESAVAVIDSGLNFLKNDSLLLSERDRYASYLPVDLTNLKPYYKGRYVYIFQDGITDIQGKNYSTGINGNGDTWATDFEDLYAIWDINRDYSKLTATVIVSESNSDSDLSATIRIYGDDKLLYEKDEINTRTKAFTIEVDISGVTDLKIALWGGGHMGWHPIDANMVDVFLFKSGT